MPNSPLSPLERTLIEDVGYWNNSQESFNQNSHNSVLIQSIGNRIYQNPAIFSGIAADTIDDNIKTQNNFAEAYWIDYARDHTMNVLDRFETEHLFNGTALSFCEPYVNLARVKNNHQMKKAMLMERYMDTLTNYSASNGEFLERLYESSLAVEYRVFRQNLSVGQNPNRGLSGERVKTCVMQGIDGLDSEHKDEMLINLALQLQNKL